MKGMLWYAPEEMNMTITEKIAFALPHFRKKYGVPKEIFANLDGLPDKCRVEGIPVYFDEQLQKNHIWIIPEVEIDLKGYFIE